MRRQVVSQDVQRLSDIRSVGLGVGGLVCVLAASLLLVVGESLAVVQVVPEAAMTVEGRAVTGRKAITAHPLAKELLAAFERAEAAVQQQHMERLMAFYGPEYNYHGLKQADVRRIWGEVFEHYRGLTSTHLFSEIRIVRVGAQLRAEVTCTGGLYGTEITSGKRITLDSWFREVHYLAQEQGGWKFLGNAGEVPSEVPFSSAPHHPLF